MEIQHNARFLLLILGPLVWTGAAASSGAASANFAVRAVEGRIDCEQVAKQCESLRSRLFNTWDRSPPRQWNPRCEVVIHFSRESYGKHVGPGSEQTFGSSLIRIAEGAVVQRRIDLLADEAGRLTALPHELTHVVLAGAFGGRKPPPWVDEGIATLADCESKRELHQRDCRQAIESGTAFRLAELLMLERFPRPDQVAAFYGQSLSLTRFLVERREQPGEFVRFVNHALEFGYDHAVKTHYGYDSVADLERDWRHQVRTNEPIHEDRSHNETLRATSFVDQVRFDRVN
jgi:hypothetical protein